MILEIYVFLKITDMHSNYIYIYKYEYGCMDAETQDFIRIKQQNISPL